MRFLAVSAAFFSIASATMLWAQSGGLAFSGMAIDPAAPVEVSADELSVDQADGTAIFSGNVEIAQGELKMTAGAMRVEYAENQEGQQEITRLLADGGVTLVTATEAAEADEAQYSIEDGTVTLIGNVLVTQALSAISGDRMVIDLASGSGRIEGRVRTTIRARDDN